MGKTIGPRKDASMKTLLRGDQLEYIDTEGMRVVTNNRCVAEQIKSDKVENVATCEEKRRECGKFGKGQKFEEHRDGWSQKWKDATVRKLENSKTDEERKVQDEENLCKSTIEGLARRNRPKRGILAKVVGKYQRALRVNDVTGKELPWHEVRQAREQEFKYLRDLGVHEKVDERDAIAKYHVTQADSKWVDTNKSLEGESPCKSKSRIVAREFESEDRPDLYAGTPPLEASGAFNSIAANHKQTFSIMHIDVSRAYFHARAQRLVLVRLPVEDRIGANADKSGLLKKEMYGTRDAASNWEACLARAHQKLGISAGTRLEEPFSS